MNPELKEKWVSALRSGKYKQGTCSFRNKEKDGSENYCCLGVLADVIDPTAWKLSLEYDTWNWFFANDRHDNAAFSSEPLDKAGMTDTEQWVLIRMNDREDTTFAEIADYIEEKL